MTCEKRYVYGTRSKKWYLVDKSDRDYSQGLTKETMKRIGKKAAKERYLSPSILKKAYKGLNDQVKGVKP